METACSWSIFMASASASSVGSCGWQLAARYIFKWETRDSRHGTALFQLVCDEEVFASQMRGRPTPTLRPEESEWNDDHAAVVKVSTGNDRVSYEAIVPG
eukprot:scaffold8701_cov97-Skeletonema_menzelii.AAC.1